MIKTFVLIYLLGHSGQFIAGEFETQAECQVYAEAFNSANPWTPAMCLPNYHTFIILKEGE